MARTERERDYDRAVAYRQSMKEGSGRSEAEVGVARGNLAALEEKYGAGFGLPLGSPPPSGGSSRQARARSSAAQNVGPGGPDVDPLHGAGFRSWWGGSTSNAPPPPGPNAGEDFFRYWESVGRGDPKARKAEDARVKVRDQRGRIEQVPGWWTDSYLVRLHSLDRAWTTEENDEEYPRRADYLRYATALSEDDISARLHDLADILARLDRTSPEGSARVRAAKAAVVQAAGGMLARGYLRWIHVEAERKAETRSST